MITRAPPDYSSEWSHLSSERVVVGENVRLSGCGIAQIQFHRRGAFHKHIYRRLDALQWRFNLANAFCALWPAGLSLSRSLVSSLSLSFWRKPVDGANFSHSRARSRQSRSVSSRKNRYFFFFFFLEMNRCSNFFLLNR